MAKTTTTRCKNSSDPTEVLAAIAKEHLFIDTLETRRSDSLDFHDVAVWAVKAALQAAFDAGRKSATGRTAPNSRLDAAIADAEAESIADAAARSMRRRKSTTI